MMIAEFVIASLRTCEHGPRLTLRSAIVIVGVGLQDSKQMHLAQDNDVVHTLTPDRSDQPFGKAILPRGGWSVGLSRMPMARNRRVTMVP